MIVVDVNNEVGFTFSATKLKEVVVELLTDHGIRRGEISLAIIDDQTMHELNRRHLQHDYPTDVLSFVLETDGDHLEGEVIVSADTAAQVAPTHDWPVEHELTLYVIHGCLHLVNYDDHSDDDRQNMRTKELHYLARAGIRPSDEQLQGHFERIMQRKERTA